jgi:hypothetical protein
MSTSIVPVVSCSSVSTSIGAMGLKVFAVVSGIAKRLLVLLAVRGLGVATCPWHRSTLGDLFATLAADGRP